MAKDGPDWDGLLKWSIAHSDGTPAPRALRYTIFSLSLSMYPLITTFFYQISAPKQNP